MVHDELPGDFIWEPPQMVLPFPIKRMDFEFVGEVYDENDQPVQADREALMQKLSSGAQSIDTKLIFPR